MRLNKTSYQYLWKESRLDTGLRSGVSLHSHTSYSEESMAITASFLRRFPILDRTLGRAIDFRNAFWTPPLSAQASQRLEEQQIHDQLQLSALVSLTDHDDIQAGMMLRALGHGSAPVSTEWTVPYRSTFFHLGIHNIPFTQAPDLMNEMKQYTARPEASRLKELLGSIATLPEVLVVLNHPLWDEEEIGQAQHEGTLAALLSDCKPFIHALEVNGLRTRTENARVFQLGEENGLPVVAGGDRHGCEPNSILNVSSATTWSEFIYEIKRLGQSQVVFMPQYRRPLALRTAELVCDILREHPGSPADRRTWKDRVFERPGGTETPVPISALQLSRSANLSFATLDAVVRTTQSRAIQALLQVGKSSSSVRTSRRKGVALPALERDSTTIV
jgi:hypothetical protein